MPRSRCQKSQVHCGVYNYITVVPHITDAIQEWVERVARVPVDGDNQTPDVCIIEVNNLSHDKTWYKAMRTTVKQLSSLTKRCAHRRYDCFMTEKKRKSGRGRIQISCMLS